MVLGYGFAKVKNIISLLLFKIYSANPGKMIFRLMILIICFRVAVRFSHSPGNRIFYYQ